MGHGIAIEMRVICLRDQARPLRHIGTTGNSAKCCQVLISWLDGFFLPSAIGSSGLLLQQIKRHPEVRARLGRASKDGRTHCAEHHPSRRAEDGAHLRMTAEIVSQVLRITEQIGLDSILVICPSCQCVAAVALDREGKSASLLRPSRPTRGAYAHSSRNAGRGAMDAKAATDERG